MRTLEKCFFSLVCVLTAGCTSATEPSGADEGESGLSQCAEVADKPSTGMRLSMKKPLADLDNALFFARLAKLAYADEAAIRADACKHGIERFVFFQVDDAMRAKWQKSYGGALPDAQGFAAVVTAGDDPKRKAVVISYRGTDSLRDVLIDAAAQKTAAKEYGVGEDVRVHRGFFLQAEALWERIEREVWSMVLTPAAKQARCAQHPEAGACAAEGFDELFYPVFFTGHSLGGAVAAIVGSRVASPKSAEERSYLARELHAPLPPEGRGYPIGGIVTFGQPRAGNQAFVDMLHARLGDSTHAARATLGAPYVRFGNEEDFVPMLPLRGMGYRHGGLEAWYDRDFTDIQVSCTSWEDTFWQSLEDMANVYASRWDQVVRAADHAMDSYVATLEAVAARADRDKVTCR